MCQLPMELSLGRLKPVLVSSHHGHFTRQIKRADKSGFAAFGHFGIVGFVQRHACDVFG